MRPAEREVVQNELNQVQSEREQQRQQILAAKNKIIGKAIIKSHFLPEKFLKNIKNPYVVIIIEYIFYFIGMIKKANMIK